MKNRYHTHSTNIYEYEYVLRYFSEHIILYNLLFATYLIYLLGTYIYYKYSLNESLQLQWLSLIIKEKIIGIDKKKKNI